MGQVRPAPVDSCRRSNAFALKRQYLILHKTVFLLRDLSQAFDQSLAYSVKDAK